MYIKINRTGKKINLLCKNNPKSYYAIDDVLKDYDGFSHILTKDIDNYNFIAWEPIEDCRLWVKNGIVYRVNCWIGEYPFKGIEIEEIGEESPIMCVDKDFEKVQKNKKKLAEEYDKTEKLIIYLGNDTYKIKHEDIKIVLK